MTREQALKVLELRGGASFQEIKRAYLDLVLVWHPDRFFHNARVQEKASARLKEINSAYDALRSYEASHSRSHEPRTKRTGSKHHASGTEQSGTQRQESHTKNHDTRSPSEQTESKKPRNKGDRSRQTLRRSVWVCLVLAGPLFFALFLDHQKSRDSLQREPIDLLSDTRGNSQPEEQADDQLQAYRPTARRGEAGTSSADTAASPPADLEIGSADSVLAARKLEDDVSRPSRSFNSSDSQGSQDSDIWRDFVGQSPAFNPLDHQGSHDSDIWRDFVGQSPAFNPLDHQGSRDSLQEEPIDLLSITREGYRPITQPDEVGAPAADAAAEFAGNLETDSANPALAVREQEASASASSSLHFTRGSHQDDVLRIQGTPSSINRYPSSGHEVWHYGFSTVEISLRDGRVTEWNNSSGNLKVSLDAGPNVTDARTFTRGSHQDDVLRIQGTPSSINRYPSSGHEVWHYGFSTVEISLRDGRVTEWNNSSGNLKVSLDAGPNVTDARTFTRGSHQDDVLRIQRTPSSINRYPSSGHEVWHYGFSTVEISLRDGRVTEWNNSSGNLKVSLDAGPNVTDARTFTRGSHQDDVLRIQGTPSSINRYPSSGHEVWHYGFSTVEISLRDGRVTEWNNSSGNLKVSLDAGPR